jgi:predicted AAA+ superfamily ATPase
MNRQSLHDLDQWLLSEWRKPLVIRGARQVGKTWSVRYLAKKHKLKLIELNFEKNPAYKGFFESNDPQTVLRAIGIFLSETIKPETHLLFLDEIQAFPEMLAKLRWFAEELPDLPVVAAGSLLEFVLADHSFSMPVGRISYLHLEPLSFEEFLLAQEKTQLLDYLREFQLTHEIPAILHQQCVDLFKEYMIIGGMPAAIASWVGQQSLEKVGQIHNELLTTYRDDFAKYRGRLPIERLEEVMHAVPRNLSRKFVYSDVNPDVHTGSLKQALGLLVKARLCHEVMSSAGNGVPLGAEINRKFIKTLFLDVGLASSMLGVNLNEILAVSEITSINKGALAEQVVGQILRTLSASYIEPKLYYWQRTEKGTSAEVDYLFQQANRVIPLEVKAGTTGTLKSLHYFMELKKLSMAIRINSDLPSKVQVNLKAPSGNTVNYTLLSLPFYLLGQIKRLSKIQD